MFGFSKEDAIRFELTPAGLSGTDGCTDQEHLDHVTFRDASDGYGWAAAVVTSRDYFVDFGGIIDFQTMNLQWSNPFYHEHYSYPEESVLLKFPYVDYRYRFEVQHVGLGDVEVPWYDAFSLFCIEDFCPVLAGTNNVVAPLTRDSTVFGTGFMQREDESLSTSGSYGEWHVALNPNAENIADIAPYESDRFEINVQAKQCAPLMNCFGPNPALGDGTVWLWSNASLWTEVFAIRRFLSDPSANPTGELPVEGENVEIPSGFTVILDVYPLPKLGRVTVSGTLIFDDMADRVLEADSILVWGSLKIGTPDNPFANKADIILHGTRTSDVLIASDDHFLGNKVLVVFGSVELFGLSRNEYKTKLAATATAGDTFIVLDTAVDWEAGDVIALAPTGVDVHALETATITASQPGNGNNTITLEAPLQYTHSVSTTTLPNGESVRLAGDVGMLSGHSIRISANDASQAADIDKEWGMHVVVGEHSYSGGASSAKRLGKLIAEGVEFKDCGQAESEHSCIQLRYFSGISQAYSMYDWLYTELDQPTNRISSSSFHNTLNGAVSAERTFGLLFERNVVHNSRSFALSLDKNSDDASIRDNLIVGNYRSPDEAHLAQCLADNSCTVKPFSAIYAEARVYAVSGNTVAGAEDTAITLLWGDESCTEGTGTIGDSDLLWSGNEVYSAMVGVRLLPMPGILASTKCILVNDLKIWKTTDVGLMTVDQKASVHLKSIVVSDNYVGISLNFIRAGSDNVVEMDDCRILGTTTASTCDAADVEGTCRTYGQYNTLASFCSSTFGDTIRRVGVALARYTNKEQTCGASGSKEVCRPVTRPIKQCAVPWLKRFGRLQATRAKMHLTNTIFYGFRDNDCGKTTRALAPLPDEPDLLPDVTLTNTQWANTDANAKFTLGYGDTSSHGKCGELCDAHQAATITDTDGTSIGHNPGTASENNVDGSVVLLSERAPGLAEPALCRYDTSTRTNMCKDFELAHVVLSSSSGIGPIVITRIPLEGAAGFGEPRQYGSVGNTDEKACAGESKNARYPFKIAISDNVVHTIRPTNPTPNNGRLEWHAPSITAKTVVKVIFADAYTDMMLFVDGSSFADKQIVAADGVQHTPTVDSDVGSWSYYPSTQTLTLVLHGHKTRYNWLGAVSMGIDIGMAAAIDVPQDAGIDVQNQAAETFAQGMAMSLSETLGIPLSQWRVVCVHPVGEICDGSRRRRVARRRKKAKTAEQHDSRRERRQTTVSSEYEIQYELTPPNEGSAYDETGATTAAYAENLQFAQTSVQKLKDATLNGQVATIANEYGGDDIAEVGVVASFSIDSPSTGDKLKAELSDDGSLTTRITVSGSVFEDVNGNGVFDNNIDGELANVSVTVTNSSGTAIATTSTDAEGAWSVPGLAQATYFVGLNTSDLPAPSAYYWKSIGDAIPFQANGDDSGSDASPLKSVHRFQKWGAVSGRVVEGVGAGGAEPGPGLEEVRVTVSDATGTPRAAETDSNGDWTVDTPAGRVTIAVDKRTLPFPQPYIGQATSNNDPYVCDTCVMGESVETVYVPGGNCVVDGIKNGDEEGIDCGGSNCEACAGPCANECKSQSYRGFRKKKYP